MTLLELFKQQLEELGIEYAWDPDFEDMGILSIDSVRKGGKKLAVGFMLDKESGAIRDIMFNEFFDHDGEYEAKRTKTNS